MTDGSALARATAERSTITNSCHQVLIHCGIANSGLDRKSSLTPPNARSKKVSIGVQI